ASGIITVTAPASTGFTYGIDGTTYQAATNFSGLATGSYSVTVMNSEGCSSAATPAVINPQPASPAAPTVTVTHPSGNPTTGKIPVKPPRGTNYPYTTNGQPINQARPLI